MKKFKELTAKIDSLVENEHIFGGAARSAHSDYGVFRIENSEQLKRVNAFLNAFTQREFIEPKHGIAQIRHKFNQMGLEFDWTPQTSKIEYGEEMKLPLSRWGGSFGTTPEHDLLKDGFYRDDNFEGTGFTLGLKVTSPNGGLCQIDAMVYPTEK
tara:strand:- start:1201 stop:1665 length:465 start_codon:yes stop_codon:yes gene_type:complete